MAMDSGLRPKMLHPNRYPNILAIEIGLLGHLDPKWMEGLDPERKMDFVLFGKVCYGYTLPRVTLESMQIRVIRLRDQEDVKGLPPLEVIFYNDLVSTAWGWERLLPWKSGFLLFEDYFGYLEQFYRENESHVFERFDLRVSDGSASLNAAAANKCMETERELNAVIAGHPGLPKVAQLHDQLSQKIVEQALDFSNPDAAPTIPAGSIVPAACFMEARLKLLELSNMKNTGEVFSVEVWRMKVEFGRRVRQAALDILIHYRGPHSEQISAALLGMANEYSFACDLLDDEKYVEYRGEVSDISHEIRIFLLELLCIIRDTFPLQSAIDYDSIKHFRIARGNRHTEYLSAPRKEIVSANEVSSANFDETGKWLVQSGIYWHVDHCVVSGINK